MRERNKTAAATRRLAVTGELDRRALEALYLEVRRLAKRYEVEIKEFRVDKIEHKPSA